MKKFILFMLIFACVLGFAGCSNKADDVDIVDIMEISGLVTEKGYTGDDFQGALLGKYRDHIIDAWGKPDGMLSGFWGDIWYLTDRSNKQIVLYYDKDGVVENVKIAERLNIQDADIHT